MKRMLVAAALAVATTSSLALTVPAHADANTDNPTAFTGTATPTAAAKTPTLTVDSESSYSNVRAMQFLLSAWSSYATPDGSYGPKTTAAVKKFQSKKGLTADGKAGPQTMRALTSTTGYPGSKNVYTTRAVQQLLKKLGYAQQVTGSYDTKTAAYVRSFQRRAQLPATGRVDQTTWAFLFDPAIPGSWQQCTESINAGIPSSQTGWVGNIQVAKCLVPDVTKMVGDARKAGVTLSVKSRSGYAWRSRATQIALRKQHCGTSYYDIYQKPPSQCSPNTARPGTSIHEYGLAIDFNVSGHPSARTWLLRNGAKYGFKSTVPSEAWHFDTKQDYHN